MPETNKPEQSQSSSPNRIRWLPGVLMVLLAVMVIIWVRFQDDWPFQKRNLTSYVIMIVASIGLLVWWTFLSRANGRLRLSVTFGLVVLGMICVALFRLKGMTGDLFPIIEFRWAGHGTPSTLPSQVVTTLIPTRQFSNAPAFPQFLGPNRNGVILGQRLDTNWVTNPPKIFWRQKVGAAWSGFAIVGNLALTQEQRGAEECVVAYELATGRQLWLHSDQAHYNTTIAGEGPRATPTVVSNRVYTFGATGILNCLDLATGNVLWSRDLLKHSGGELPQWGCASSPLVANDLVIVHGGEGTSRSLYAFRVADGTPAWSAGQVSPSYASPSLLTLADKPQLLAFNHRLITAHDPVSGALLWQQPWGNGNVVCASPVLVSGNRVLFSSGYGVGAELLEITRATNGGFSAQRIWKSLRMKAKFSHLFERDGFLYGLDDGIFACVDLRDGSQRWKEGRYGHGQGLVVAESYLLMTESGELVLLQPTSASPNETARFTVFSAKTWNPIALSSELLLVRNDTEAACLRLKLSP
ncbi:MAG: PQQ-like beta-propeller repeat protein [Verrucomicrobia bacterium]|nr:PQQ-like beta-propeller repeat protein [Verrucomicrobiota bacterium]